MIAFFVFVFFCMQIQLFYSLHLPEAMSEPPDTSLNAETRKSDASAASG